MKKAKKTEEKVPTKGQFDASLGNFGEVMRLAQLGLQWEQREMYKDDPKLHEEAGMKGLNAISFVAQFLGEVDKFYKEEVPKK